MRKSKSKRLTDDKIAEMFLSYIEGFDGGERHTKTACDEADDFDEYTEELFSDDIEKQVEVYSRMMNVAVEFEESGFIAGVRWALDHMK